MNKLSCSVIPSKNASPAQTEGSGHETLMVTQRDSSTPRASGAQNDDRRRS